MVDARDYTIRDYRSHLFTDRRAKPASVNLTLRHTCLTRLVRAGNDILVAELAGHARLETTRRYSLPSHVERPTAMDALTVDY